MEEWDKQPEEIQDAMGEELVAQAEVIETVHDSE